MKKLWMILLTLFLILQPNNYSSAENNKFIVVNGEYSIEIEPNLAYLTVTTLGKGQTSKSALEENTKKNNKLLLGLKNMGIRDDDIINLSFYLNPVYNYKDNLEEFSHYEVSNSLEIKVRNLEKLGFYLEGITSLDISNISNIRYDLENANKIYNETLSKAIDISKSRAEYLLKGINREIEDIISIEEISNNYYTSQNQSIMDFKESMESEISPLDIQVKSRKIKLNAKVKSKFKIK